ncbi:MAG: hypothetical protein E6356_16830 [Terrisporobacter othiniensis]|nr:hypothetical protein [Terrisporobacter othiniensis]
MNKLRELACDLYFGKSQYSEKDGSDIIREMIFEKTEPLPSKMSDASYKRWLDRNGYVAFEIIQETVNAVYDQLKMESFGQLVDFESFDLGQKKDFIIENDELYKAALMADDVRVAHFQTLYDEKVPTKYFRMGVGVAVEMFDFLTGKKNITKIIDKIMRSIDRKDCALITSTIFGAYDTTNNPQFCEQTTQALLAEKLRDKIAKIGGDVQILGTKAALSKIENSGAIIDTDKADKRNFGYVKVFEGTPCVELPNYFDKNTGVFDVKDDMLILIPSGEKIVKYGVEGEIEVYDDVESKRGDYMINLEINKRVHLGVVIAARFAMLKIQG